MTTAESNRERIEKLEKAFEKLNSIVVGNGTRGMDEIVRNIEAKTKALEKELKERMDALENAQGITNSEINHFRNVYFLREGLDAMGNPKQRTWLKKTWEDNIAPNLLNNTVTAIIIIIIWNLRDLLELIAVLGQ